MFERVFVEEQVCDSATVRRILDQLPRCEVLRIRKVEDVFGRVHRPYLQKRQGLQLFLGRKEGDLVKVAPDAYGFKGEPHYYFVHAYNCIYECEYCYLQGYFSSPDIVMFVNHDEIAAEMAKVAASHTGRVWFHAGEFSDSLALAGLSREFEVYWQAMEAMVNARLELRSKSGQTRLLERLPVQSRIVPSFSIAPEEHVRLFEHRTAPVAARLQGAARLQRLGYEVGLHLDPVVPIDGFQEAYHRLVDSVGGFLDWNRVAYVSLGVVRFSPDVYRAVRRHYPRSRIFEKPFYPGRDGKMRLPRPMRMKVLSEIENSLVERGFEPERIYRCMEDSAPVNPSSGYEAKDIASDWRE